LGIFLAILSVAGILIVLWDAFETIILPRRVTRRVRLAAFFFRGTWRPWRALALHIRKPRRREAVLGYYGPLSMLALLTLWAVVLVFAFATLEWSLGLPVSAPEKQPDFATYLYMSGTDFFTLGLGDVTALPGFGRFLSVFEGGLGFGFLAIIIGYFPVLYQAFSRREVNISLLDARAGSPSSAIELLRHYSEHGSMDALETTLEELERWTAELLESHISYPVLSFFRSQHDNQSWLGALTTILDSCALLGIGVDGVPARQARLTFAMARHAAVDIAQILNAPPRPPDPDRLPPEEFARLRAALAEAGLRLGADHDAVERLTHLRKMYEPYVAALGERLSMRLPAWVPERRAVHNWETSAWGRSSAAAPLTPVASSEPVEDDHA
jgi:hypothetical protein